MVQLQGKGNAAWPEELFYIKLAERVGVPAHKLPEVPTLILSDYTLIMFAEQKAIARHERWKNRPIAGKEDNANWNSGS